MRGGTVAVVGYITCGVVCLVLPVCFCNAQTNSSAVGVVNHEVDLSSMDRVELPCPVPALEAVDSGLSAQWVTPGFFLVSGSSVDAETGTFAGDGRLVLSATNDSLTISPVCCLDLGDYRCIVSRPNQDGTRLIIAEAVVSLRVGSESALRCDTMQQGQDCNLPTTHVEQDTNSGAEYTWPPYAIYVAIAIFTCGMICGVLTLISVRLLFGQCKRHRHRRMVAKLRTRSVELAARAGSVKRPSVQSEEATKDPKQFAMVVNPLQEAPGYATDPPSPPPRLTDPDQTSLSVSRDLCPGRLTVAIHAGSLQELNTAGTESAASGVRPKAGNRQQQPANAGNADNKARNTTDGINHVSNAHLPTASDRRAANFAVDGRLPLEAALAFKAEVCTEEAEPAAQEAKSDSDSFDESTDYQGLDFLSSSTAPPSAPSEAPVQHAYTSVKLGAAIPPMPRKATRTSSSDDYEHLNLMSPRYLSIKGSKYSYLRPLRSLPQGDGDDYPPPPPCPPPPPPPSPPEPRSVPGTGQGSHANLPLPPPPLQLDGCPTEWPIPVVLDNRGYTTLQTVSTWPRRVSSKRQRPSIAAAAGIGNPEYLEIICSADCICTYKQGDKLSET